MRLDQTAVDGALSVDAEGLRLRAGRRTVFDGLALTLDTGVHGLLGPNGAGKTTLVRALATVLRPAGGRLRLLGHDAAGTELRALRRRLGYLPQDFRFYPRYTVREFVEHMAWLKEVPADRVGVAVERALQRVDLADRAGDRMKTLSGGMARRAGVAQAIVNDPELLLLDEPTAGLDPEQRVAFRRLLRELGEDACVVVSTHLVEDVAAACTEVVLLDEGRLAWRGDVDGLRDAAGPQADAGDDGAGNPIERGYAALLAAHRTAAA